MRDLRSRFNRTHRGTSSLGRKAGRQAQVCTGSGEPCRVDKESTSQACCLLVGKSLLKLLLSNKHFEVSKTTQKKRNYNQKEGGCLLISITKMIKRNTRFFFFSWHDVVLETALSGTCLIMA